MAGIGNEIGAHALDRVYTGPVPKVQDPLAARKRTQLHFPALVAAADPRTKVGAVVSRGGRPDLAGRSLMKVSVPTLLIVGGQDDVVFELNRQAQAAIPGKCKLSVVPRATHLFEEPGTLEQVAKLAREWFIDHLSRVAARP